MIKLAIVSPCYNEEEVLEESTTRLTALFDDLVAKKKISADSFVLFVNDGSKDRTWSIIKQLHRTNPYIKGMNLARNVGHQYAIMAGMMTAKDWSDAVITIDADLQDDLNAIEEMIDAYTQGYDVVYGVKVSRQADPMLKRLSATAFYKLQHRMGVETIYNHADFRFLSRRVLEQLSHYQERNVYLRGIIPLLGFPSTTVDDVIRERTAGTSKYTVRKMFSLALDGITSFSVKPIYGIVYLGIIFVFISILNAERPCKTVPEIVRSSRLQSHSVMHKRLYAIRRFRACEFIAFGLSAADNGHSQRLFAEIGVNVKHSFRFRYCLFRGRVRRMSFLPQELSRTQERTRRLFPTHNAAPLVVKFRQISVRMYNM